ncbi:MAG: murein biosynthesis integral membrane protein MurJ [Oscillospiraceae bacterium]|nr:murein biosynthesis integral membrane protein MurJ [Oscillospiraceae bacterium]
MSDRRDQRLKTVSLVILITLLGRVLGLGREMLLAQTFGTGWEADALSMASLLPRTFFDAVFASAVAASFIPVYTETLELEGRGAADRLASSFFTIVGLAAATLTAVGMIFAPQVIALMTDFAPQTAALASDLLVIIFPSLFFTGLAFSMVGVLNSLGQFNVPAAMSIASNGILIVYFLFFAPRFGVYGAAVAFAIGWGAQAIMQVPSLVKRGFRYRPGLRHPGLKKIFRLMLPVMASSWIQPINMLIIARFATAWEGGAASLNYANGLYIMVAGIFVLSVTNVIFPEMSRLSATGDRRALGDVVRDTTRTLLFLLIPMTLGLMILATPLVQLLYEYRGAFDEHSTALTASALAFMSLGMVGYGIQNVLIRAFYAEKRGRPPLIAGIVGVAVNVLLCLLLVDAMGVAGLALASAVSLLMTALVLIPGAHRMLGGQLVTGKLLLELGKMVLAALVMAVAVWFVRELLAGALGGGTILMRIGLVLAPTAAGGLIYLGLAHILKLDEMKVLRGYLRKRRGEGV